MKDPAGRQRRREVIGDDPPPSGKLLKRIDHHRLPDVEESKKGEAGHENEPRRNPLDQPKPPHEAQGHGHKLIQDDLGRVLLAQAQLSLAAEADRKIGGDGGRDEVFEDPESSAIRRTKEEGPGQGIPRYQEPPCGPRSDPGAPR